MVYSHYQCCCFSSQLTKILLPLVILTFASSAFQISCQNKFLKQYTYRLSFFQPAMLFARVNLVKRRFVQSNDLFYLVISSLLHTIVMNFVKAFFFSRQYFPPSITDWKIKIKCSVVTDFWCPNFIKSHKL